jgi:hypothetical protein
MTAQDLCRAQDPVTLTDTNFTLDPLRLLGRAALDTHDVPGLTSITLFELQLVYDDDLERTEVLHSLDVFHDLPPIPPAAHLAQASLSVLTPAAAAPRVVTLRPPHRIEIESSPPELPQAIKIWAAKRHFTVEQVAAELLAAIFLVIGSASPPELNNEDRDPETAIEQPLHSAIAA